MAAAQYHADPALGTVTDRENLTSRPVSGAKPPSLNDRLASAYRNIEPSVYAVGTTCDVFEVLMDHLLGKREGTGDTCTFDMTASEWNMLFHQMYEVTNKARDLAKLYEAGFKQAA